MAEIIKFPEKKNKNIPAEPGMAHRMEKEQESNVEINTDKMLFLMGKLAAIKREDPGIFHKTKIDHEMEELKYHSDYSLIMRVNNCNEMSIRNNPILYLAINYEVWNRGLMRDDNKENKPSKLAGQRFAAAAIFSISAESFSACASASATGRPLATPGRLCPAAPT